MKKAVSLILAFTICFTLGANAYSAKTAEEYAEFNCLTKSDGLSTIYIITEENGKTVCKEKYLTGGTEVTFSCEETDPDIMRENGFDTAGKHYVFVSTEIGSGYIDTKDVVPAEEKYSPKEVYPATFSFTYYVSDSGGVPMRKGPSLIYDTVYVMPQGTEFTVQYFDTSCANPAYGYVTSGGHSGWVYLYDYAPEHSVCYTVDEFSYFTGKLEIIEPGVHLVDINRGENGQYIRLSEDIPVGTVMKFSRYCFLSENDVAAYTEYKGVKGWIKFSLSTSAGSHYYVIPYVYDIAFAAVDTPLYSERGNTASAAGKSIPAGTAVNVNAYYGEIKDGEYTFWVNTEYDGESYWVASGEKSGFAVSTGVYALAYVNSDTVSLYNVPQIGAEPDEVLHYGDRITLLLTVLVKGLNWYYVNTQDGGGAVRKSAETINIYGTSKRHALRMDKNGKTVLGVSESFQDPGVMTTAATEKNETEKDTQDKEFPVEKVIIGAVAAAVVLGAAAISTVTTLKKNKKEKEENAE